LEKSCTSESEHPKAALACVFDNSYGEGVRLCGHAYGDGHRLFHHHPVSPHGSAAPRMPLLRMAMRPRCAVLVACSLRPMRSSARRRCHCKSRRIHLTCFIRSGQRLGFACEVWRRRGCWVKMADRLRRSVKKVSDASPGHIEQSSSKAPCQLPRFRRSPWQHHLVRIEY
jgi:hypothetical protein